MEVLHVSLKGLLEEMGFMFEGNLAFTDFRIKEGEFGGPFLMGMPELSVGKEVKRGWIT